MATRGQQINPHDYVAHIADLFQAGRSMPTPAGGAHAVRRNPAGPVCLILSPHPDDECITGGIAWRLQQEAGWQVVNLALTHGSNEARQLERAQELQAACAVLGFESVLLAERGLVGLRPHTRHEQPALWQHFVAAVVKQLHRYQPALLLCPHPSDAQSAHQASYQLTLDALQCMPAEFSCLVAFGEYWSTMDSPNYLLELSRGDMAQLLCALMQHRGEVQRNPYHASLPAWAIDNVRRGAERVGLPGAQAPNFEFAALYQIQSWQGGQLTACWQGGRFAPIGTAPALQIHRPETAPPGR